MRSAVALLAFAASAYAYSVTFPSATDGWTNSGAQSLEWSRVSTDPTTFTVLLVNDDANYSQQLAASVDGTLGNTTVNPPSGGWPSPAGAYRVNLVTNTTDNAILAQSVEFNITAATSNSTSTTSTSGSSSASSGTTAIVNTGTAAAGTSGTNTATSASTSATSGTKNGAASLGVQTGLFGILALVGALLVV
ncbi:hypothetical protein BT96DRAFT_469509 [Gymnopus androsaceus JB14]|uniref:Yeast cell wall synthesis Kre9/Knh1-like N-terminal domain-containing protein n=1 Tax=Gymnopus androsaceus JB14 TaxID=1447944 RepID=A0A6A4IHZ7_9AGAR|nr:hypothetical protein BT96DRAFT_469509 [Gymnopus androsaceus JB14]